MISKMCPGCKKIISQNLKQCSQCQVLANQNSKEAKRKRNQRYNSHRNTIHSAFYQSQQWKRLREVKLSLAGYLCEHCKKAIAVEVHHIIPISDDWNRKLDMNNLQCLCISCHNFMHNRWSGSRGVGEKV